MTNWILSSFFVNCPHLPYEIKQVMRPSEGKIPWVLVPQWGGVTILRVEK
jgi:hypothetical protein